MILAVFKVLKERILKNNTKKFTYVECGDIANQNLEICVSYVHDLGYIFGKIADACFSLNYPILSSIVTRMGEDIPRHGYFIMVNREHKYKDNQLDEKEYKCLSKETIKNAKKFVTEQIKRLRNLKEENFDKIKSQIVKNNPK